MYIYVVYMLCIYVVYICCIYVVYMLYKCCIYVYMYICKYVYIYIRHYAQQKFVAVTRAHCMGCCSLARLWSDTGALPTDDDSALQELFGLGIDDVKVKAKSHVGYQMYLGDWLHKFRRKSDCVGDKEARLDATFLAHRAYLSFGYRCYTHCWLHLNKPEFKASWLKLKLKLTRTIIGRDYEEVLSTLAHFGCHTAQRIGQSLARVTSDAAFCLGSLTLGQSWFALNDPEGMHKRHADQFVEYICNSSRHSSPQGQNEFLVFSDEDATAFDFYGTLHHASFPSSVRDVERRARLSKVPDGIILKYHCKRIDQALESCSNLRKAHGEAAAEWVDSTLRLAAEAKEFTAEEVREGLANFLFSLEVSTQSTLGLWPTGTLSFRNSGTTTGAWDTLLQNSWRNYMYICIYVYMYLCCIYVYMLYICIYVVYICIYVVYVVYM